MNKYILYKCEFPNGKIYIGITSRFKVDGIIIRQYEAIMPDNITEEPIISADVVVPVEAGPHNVQIFWSTSVGTITGRSAYRTLTVTEL